MLSSVFRRMFSTGGKKPLKVAVTGAAGQIGYSLLFHIAGGKMLGLSQPIILNLVDIPQSAKMLNGVRMELEDCAFPLVEKINCHDNAKDGFAEADICMLVGAKPRGPGMERADLLKGNAQIFIEQGKIIDQVANPSCKILVVGNPANTNAMIGSTFAKRIPKENWTAMTRLDHDRGLAQLKNKSGCAISDIKNFCIWGNHSPTMFPDLHQCTIKGKPAIQTVGEDWYKSTFTPSVQKRGAEVIAARGLSSAASAANAAFSHVRSWVEGSNNEWVSMGVVSNGEYGIPKGLVFSYPVTTKDGKWKIVEGINLNQAQKDLIKITTDELVSERAAV